MQNQNYMKRVHDIQMKNKTERQLFMHRGLSRKIIKFHRHCMLYGNLNVINGFECFWRLFNDHGAWWEDAVYQSLCVTALGLGGSGATSLHADLSVATHIEDWLFEPLGCLPPVENHTHTCFFKRLWGVPGQLWTECAACPLLCWLRLLSVASLYL